MADPYAPPAAELADQPSRPWAPWAAVLLGLLVDVGGSALTGLFVGVGYAAFSIASGADPKSLTENLAGLASDPWAVGISAIVGGFFSLLGGWLCARLAQRRDYKLGIVLAILSFLCGLLMSANEYSPMVHVMFAALTFASVLIGTRLGFPRTAERASP